jgi:hypothetical protein
MHDMNINLQNDMVLNRKGHNYSTPYRKFKKNRCAANKQHLPTLLYSKESYMWFRTAG